MSLRVLLDNQRGTILPLAAILIVVLIGFAAFAVDLGAAWAERRQLQSAADAGSMAAILPPLAVGDSIAKTAMDLVDANVGTPVDRFGCGGWTPSVEGVSGTFILADPGVSDCVWISTATEANETLVAVKVPTQQLQTRFAPVIGIDSISVGAFAVSQIGSAGRAHILPFVLTSGPSAHECLGSPPAGISRNPCTGANSGNFGFLASPFHGSTTLGTSDSCPPGGMNDLAILEMNIAIGTDHPVQNDLKWPADSAAADSDNPDECVNKAPPTSYIPDSVVTLPGGHPNELHAGLVSNDVFGNLDTPSRLQQDLRNGNGSDNVKDTRTVKNQNVGDFTLDNVGLWEYIKSGTDACDPTTVSNASWKTGGEIATTRVENCLRDANAGTASVVFEDSLWDSPRFAIIPELWGTVPPGASDSRAIEQFRGVYLHGAWFNCSAGPQPDACLVFEDIDGNDQPVFFPGEGDADACEPRGASSTQCKNSQIRGLSSLVLPIESVPPSVMNGSSPNVRLLYR